MSSDRPGVIFDVDGTLVDSNYLHVLAWRRAFGAAGRDVPDAVVHRRVGMGAELMVEELFGPGHEELTDAHAREYEPLKEELRPLPRAAELLRAVAGRGAAVVLATSSDEKDVDVLREVIDADDAIAAVTSAGDVDQAKPSPSIFEVALEKGGLDPATTVVVGDTVWDVKAATRAGLECVCVRSGGISGADLTEAGAIAVYEDVAELLDRLDESPLARILG